MALSISVTVNGRLVSGFTHLSATVVAMSLNMESKFACLSFSDTWSSPLAKIWNILKICTHCSYAILSHIPKVQLSLKSGIF